MATLTLAYDHARDPMNPEHLADLIATALTLTSSPTVTINPTQIVVTHPNVTGANTVAIQAVVAAYVFDPVWSGGAAAVLAQKAQAALTANATFQALAAPTNAQTLAQVLLLTKECNVLIRLALGLSDTTRGT